MSHPELAPNAQRYRVADDTTDPDSEPHLLNDADNGTKTLCGTAVVDPQAIAGTTTSDQIPEIDEADSGDICTGCVRQAHHPAQAHQQTQ